MNWTGVGILVLLLGAGFWAPSDAQAWFGKKNKMTVRWVIDGNTLELSDGQRVRLIGIESPERFPNEKLKRDAERTGMDPEVLLAQGQESAEFLESIVMGYPVELELDIVNSDRNNRDAEGRILAYVKVYWKTPPAGVQEFFGAVKGKSRWRPHWIQVNAMMIQSGKARFLKRHPFSRYQEFEYLEAEAKRSSVGFWSDWYPTASTRNTGSPTS